MRIDSATAHNILHACHVPLGTNFHTLPSATVESLLACANEYDYRKPRNANGSRGRYFHDMLQRRAARKD